MNEKNKTTKVKARLPKGMRDVDQQEVRALREMITKISEVYERFGFEPLDTPVFEYTDTLGKFLPDTDRPNQGVFSFQDEDEQWLSLRYDLTAPLARHVAGNFDKVSKPFRRYQSGYVYRNEKPGPGRFRQFMQFDADTVGTSNPAADAEMCMLAVETLEALGLAGKFVIKVNNRKILDGILESIGLGGADNSSRRLMVLRAIDKCDKFDWVEIEKLLGPGRKDESGDFTKGAGLDEQQILSLHRYLNTDLCESHVSSQHEHSLSSIATTEEKLPSSNKMRINHWRELVCNSENGTQGIYELEQIAEICRQAGYDSDRIIVDTSVVRGLEYYTGSVFEAELTFAAKDESGKLIRFGSVGGGGRYDGLVSRFVSQAVPATGFSIGVSRLYAALQHLDKLTTSAKVLGPVVVLVLDKERINDYQRMTQELRRANIRAEMYVGNAGMKAQMKYADKRGAPCVIIQGQDELDRHEVTIKDLLEGARLSGEIADHAKWKESRPAQFSIPRDQLVIEVQKLVQAQKRS